MDATVGTIKNLIWGEDKKEEEKHEEPANGKLGNTDKGEPYDAGNIDSTLIDSAVMESTTKSAIAPTKLEPQASSTSASASVDPASTIADTKIDPLFSADTSLPVRSKADDLTAKPEELAHPSLAAGESLVAGGEQEQPLPEGHKSYPVGAVETAKPEELSHPSVAAGVSQAVGAGVEHPLPEGHKSYPIQSSSYPKVSNTTSLQGSAVPHQSTTESKVDSSGPAYLEKKAAEEKPNSAGERIGAGGELHKESVGSGSGEHLGSCCSKTSGGDPNAPASGVGKEADHLHKNTSSDRPISADDESTGDGIGGDAKQKKSLKEKLHDGKEKIKEKLHKN